MKSILDRMAQVISGSSGSALGKVVGNPAALAAELERTGYFADLPPDEGRSLYGRVAREGFVAAFDHRMRWAVADSESLAEGGIGGWLTDDLSSVLLSRGVRLPQVEDRYHETGYLLVIGGRVISVLTQAELEQGPDRTWGLALVRAVQIADELMAPSVRGERLYALNNANDGFVWLLSPEQADAIVRFAGLAPLDRPYLPIDDPPWFGQAH